MGFETPRSEEGGTEISTFSAFIRAVFSSCAVFSSFQWLTGLHKLHLLSGTLGMLLFFPLVFIICLLAPRVGRGALCRGTRLGPDPQLNTAHTVPTLTHVLTQEPTRNINK